MPTIELTDDELAAVTAVIEEARRVWAERFDKLDQHLRDIQRVAAGSSPAGSTQEGERAR